MKRSRSPRKSGIDPHTFVDMLTATLFAAPVYKTYGGLIADERYRPAGFRLSLGLEDLTLAFEAARDKTVPLPVASLVRDHMMEGLAQGYEDAEDREGLREGHLWGAGV